MGGVRPQPAAGSRRVSAPGGRNRQLVIPLLPRTRGYDQLAADVIDGLAEFENRPAREVLEGLIAAGPAGGIRDDFKVGGTVGRRAADSRGRVSGNGVARTKDGSRADVTRR